MSSGTVIAWVLIGSMVIAAVVAAFRLRQTHSQRPQFISVDRAMSVELSGKSNHFGRVWVVYNPTKIEDFDLFRRTVSRAVIESTGRPAMWIETTVEDPGAGQTIEALRNRAALVMAAGGDGTVRAVASGMAFSRVPMGLLPMGTGNLLARNLGVPLDLDRALVTALTPVARRMDLAWMRLDRVTVPPYLPAEGMLLRQAGADQVRTLPKGVSEPETDEFAYVVIAGVGFDGQTMADTDPSLKKKIGWSAYVLAALKSLHIERMRATVTVYHREGEDADSFAPTRVAPIPKAVETAVRNSHTLGSEKGVSPAMMSEDTWDMTGLRARTILFANCGTLPFAVLAPEASLDDGKMDLIAIDTRAGLLGWTYLSMKIFSQSAGLKPINTKNDPGIIQFRQTGRARVDVSRAYPVQIDGDPIGEARTVFARVDQGALIIRVPKSTIGRESSQQT